MFSALNILILILYWVLGFHSLDFSLAGKFIIIIIIIIIIISAIITSSLGFILIFYRSSAIKILWILN